MWLRGIPIPPSLNNAYPSDKLGRRFKSAKFKAWEKIFSDWTFLNSLAVTAARNEFSQPIPESFVHIQCEFFFHASNILCRDGSPKKNDTSNRLKILHDAVSEVIWLDDKYFFDGTFTKRPISNLENERVNVCLEWVRNPWSRTLPPRL